MKNDKTIDELARLADAMERQTAEAARRREPDTYGESLADAIVGAELAFTDVPAGAASPESPFTYDVTIRDGKVLVGFSRPVQAVQFDSAKSARAFAEAVKQASYRAAKDERKV